MSDIVISEFMDEAAIARTLAGRDVLYDPTLVDHPEKLMLALADCRALVVRNRTQVRGALLDAAPNLKVVGRLGVGLDNIDVAACKARGISVRPASGANDLAVAEYVVCAAMMLLRRAYLSSARVAAGSWPRMDLVGSELSGKQLGLVGFGAIARLTAEKFRALGVSVCAYDPFVSADDAARAGVTLLDLYTLLANSDVVSLHVPLTEATRNLIDASALARMKPGAVLINAARGGVVDEASLADALRRGALGGAALDVFAAEPLDANAGAVFADLPNLILTPHIAGVTEESNARVSDVIAAAVLEDLRD